MSNKGKKYKHHNNTRERVIYWLNRAGLAAVSVLIPKGNKKKGKK